MTQMAFGLIALAVSTGVHAAVRTETLEYRHGEVVLEGYLAYDDATAAKRPGVMVAHAWMGLDAYARMRAEQLAALGYVALAVDIYGKGVRPATREEARAQSAIYRNDRRLMRDRARAGLEALRKHPLCDPTRVAAIGYCFGGGVALELARDGADLAGVVSFHGNLDTPNPSDAKNIRGKVLVLHGADDPAVPTERVIAFQKEMRDAGVDWQMVCFGGAVHAFTDPGAGNDPKKAAAYNANADRRSWEMMRDFFREIFGE